MQSGYVVEKLIKEPAREGNAEDLIYNVSNKDLFFNNDCNIFTFSNFPKSEQDASVVLNFFKKRSHVKVRVLIEKKQKEQLKRVKSLEEMWKIYWNESLCA